MRAIKHYRRMRTALAYSMFFALYTLGMAAGFRWWSLLIGGAAVMVVALCTPEEAELIAEYEKEKRELKEIYQNVYIAVDPWEEVR